MIKCPQCTKEFNYFSVSTRPFCSERCQLIDMGHWFSESYAVPDKSLSDLEESSEEFIEDKNEEE